MSRHIRLQHIQSWIAEGRGFGHGHSYIPWIKIATRGSPTLGNLQFRFIPELGRHGHLLSAGELHLVRLLLYLGVADLREQFPCWPWPSHHPLYQHPEFNPRNATWSIGTIAIAERLGLTHPIYPGTKLFHVPTIDVLATVQSSPDYRAVAFSVKPDPNENTLSEWDAAKLAIQASYCKELNIPWHLVSANQFPETLRENLKILFQYSSPKPELDALLAKFSTLLTPAILAGNPITICIKSARTQLGLPENISQELFHRALWFKTIPIDLREPWVLSQPAHICDQSWIETTWNYMLGGLK